MRKPITRAVLLLLGLSPLNQLRAQVFEPGYLVLSRGDTLRGEVENAFWTDPPTVVRFRASNTAPAVAYRARQLRAVQLSSGRLLRHELLPIDYAAQKNPDRLPRGYVTRQKPDSLLADVLVEGPASLLSAQSNQVQHFFVRRESQPYLELTERYYLSNDGGRRPLHMVDANNYRGLLERYFGDCPAAVQASGRAAYKAVDLVQVVQAYNQACSAQRQPGRRIQAAGPPKERIRVEVGAQLGLRYNSTRLRATDAPGQEAQTLDGLQLDGRSHLQPGIYCDVLLGGRRLAIHTAAMGSRFGRTQSIASPDGSSQWNGQLDWRGTNLTVLAGLRGFLPVGRHGRFMLGSGCEVGYYWVRGAELRYGTGAAERPIVGQLKLPSSYVIDLGYASNLLPYFEAGYQHGRVSVQLLGRVYGRQNYYDPITVASTTQTNGVVYKYEGYYYSARTVSGALQLGYQLNGNSDLRRAAR